MEYTLGWKDELIHTFILRMRMCNYLYFMCVPKENKYFSPLIIFSQDISVVVNVSSKNIDLGIAIFSLDVKWTNSIIIPKFKFTK